MSCYFANSVGNRYHSLVPMWGLIKTPSFTHEAIPYFDLIITSLFYTIVIQVIQGSYPWARSFGCELFLQSFRVGGS